MKIHLISSHRINTDGNGVVSLVALPGCNLNCKYCINEKLLKSKPKEFDIDDVFKSLMKDYCYYIASNGGVCFGGGEPLLNYKDLIELAEKLKLLDINIGIETAINVETDILSKVIDYIDYFIIDIKSINNDIYKKYTGKDNCLVIKNLEFLKNNNLQDKCLIRIPKIPDYNDVLDMDKSKEFLLNMGFNNIDMFEYVIKE